MAGTYIAQSDIEGVFGVANVAAWSVVDPDGDTSTANAARVTLAIAYGEAYVEDRFRSSRYAVPFTSTGSAFPPIFKDWMAKIAGVWLYDNRGIRNSGGDEDSNRIRFHLKVSNELMDLYLSGQRTAQLTLQQQYGNCPSIPGVPNYNAPYTLTDRYGRVIP